MALARATGARAWTRIWSRTTAFMEASLTLPPVSVGSLLAVTDRHDAQHPHRLRAVWHEHLDRRDVGVRRELDAQATRGDRANVHGPSCRVITDPYGWTCPGSASG